jgi:Pyruvate/2-oxoacid:ferredoxin oxidoreductase delta subunit
MTVRDRTWPPAEYAFGYRTPPRSGNAINGRGVPARSRAVQIFHGSGARKLEWGALEAFFALTSSFRLLTITLWNRWLLRAADGPLARPRVAVDDPAAMAAGIKARAQALGAHAVGVARVSEGALYAGYESPYANAVVVALSMDHDEMLEVPEERGALEAMRCYRDISKIVIALARHIRGLGWPARAYGEGADILYLPLAIEAGIGELGKHGSLISRELGSSFRLAAVLTDLPLAPDTPVDIGVDDLCLSCRRCTLDCPADAIADRKQLVRGVDKWYVDFDRCAPYFVKANGCGICIEVCPWTEPGRGPTLSRSPRSSSPSARGAAPSLLDPLAGGRAADKSAQDFGHRLPHPRLVLDLGGDGDLAFPDRVAIAVPQDRRQAVAPGLRRSRRLLGRLAQRHVHADADVAVAARPGGALKPDRGLPLLRTQASLELDLEHEGPALRNPEPALGKRRDERIGDRLAVGKVARRPDFDVAGRQLGGHCPGRDRAFYSAGGLRHRAASGRQQRGDQETWDDMAVHGRVFR